MEEPYRSPIMYVYVASLVMMMISCLDLGNNQDSIGLISAIVLNMLILMEKLGGISPRISHIYADILSSFAKVKVIGLGK